MEVSEDLGVADENTSMKWTFHPAWAIPIGFLLAFSEMIARLLAGKGVVDSIWPHAVRSLEWTMALRNSPTLTLSSMLIIAGLSYGLRKAVVAQNDNRAWQTLPYGFIGLLIGLIIAVLMGLSGTAFLYV